MSYSPTLRQFAQLHSGGKLEPVLIRKIAIFLSNFQQNTENGTKTVKMVEKHKISGKYISKIKRMIQFE